MLSKGPYNPSLTEPNILKYWLENKFYKPEYHAEKALQTIEEMKKDGREPFCIINPPPNAYMRPHTGNVSGYAYQDVFLRYNRLLGNKVLGQPGKDHAGIQGEVVVEKMFIENKGKTKQDMGRDKFYMASYAHFQKLMPMVMADEQRIGLSSDFERNLFTLDPRIVDTVLGTFIKMFRDKMIYKGVRVVNWDPIAQTTLADIDTERKERETELVYINYPLKDEIDGLKYISVATTRAETMLGDTAVIVHPKDKRYQKFVGKTVILPLTNREVPIITSIRVEKDFGTGAVKLTPAHAYDDYVMMTEWNAVNPDKKIGYLNIIDKKGEMAGPIPAKYLGMKTEEARKAVEDDLGDLIFKREKHTQSVVIGERSKAVIEQIMSSQWFIEVEKLKQPAIDAVKNGEIDIYPKHLTRKYLLWLENLRDWPVSRSLWWGYRFPVWYKGKVEEQIDKNGQVIQTIGDEQVTDIVDAVNKGLAKVQTNPPGTKLSVFRHGGTQGNIDGRFIGCKDEDLNEVGIKQVQIAINNLKEKGEKFDLIITSPLKRAKNSAQIIAKEMGIPIIENTLLRERNFGELDGLTWEDFSQKFPDIAAQNTPTFQDCLPSGESIADVEARVKDFLQEISKEYQNKNILVMTHAGIIRILKRVLGGVSLEESRSEDIKNAGSIDLYLKDQEWTQDESVFDTWFSSGQWPYATLKANDLMDTFFPTDIMETGYDILELWVSRMIMLSLYHEGKIPFKHVYLHGLVKAPDGQKMSKSKNNVVHPEEIINKYGADSLRLLYIVGNTPGTAYPISYEKLEGYKRFLNKIWNASKFVLGFINDQEQEIIDMASDKNILNSAKKQNFEFTTRDQEMLEKMEKLTGKVKKQFEKFRIGFVADELYQEFWHDFCDIYLEEVKPRLYTKDKMGKEINTSEKAQQEAKSGKITLLYLLKQYLILLHPFVPFITEEIWQALPKTESESKTIMYAKI